MKKQTTNPQKVPLKDIKSTVVEKVTAMATEKINTVIASQLGDAAKGILGPVVEKGIGSIINLLGLTPEQAQTDTEKIMEELGKIREDLKALKAELVKINKGIEALGDLITVEVERINQAAKYRDFMDARESIDAMWAILWGVVTSLTTVQQATDLDEAARKRKVKEAVDLYKFQTAGFAVKILEAMSKMQNAVLKMFDDRESLFDRIARVSLEESKTQMLSGISGIYEQKDAWTYTRVKNPDLWSKLEAGPGGKAIREPQKYSGGPNLKYLTNNWCGDTWFVFQAKAKPILQSTVEESKLTIFIAEVNMMTAKALYMLAIIFRDQSGLAIPANKVIEVNNKIMGNANSNYNNYSDTLKKWVKSTGKWGEAPVKNNLPYPDQTTLFGRWAIYWLHTGTGIRMPSTYVAENGQYYPCSIFFNDPGVKTSAERIWRADSNMMMMAYYVDSNNKLVYKMIWQQLGQNLPDWFTKYMDAHETPITEIEKFAVLQKKKAVLKTAKTPAKNKAKKVSADAGKDAKPAAASKTKSKARAAKTVKAKAKPSVKSKVKPAAKAKKTTKPVKAKAAVKSKVKKTVKAKKALAVKPKTKLKAKAKKAVVKKGKPRSAKQPVPKPVKKVKTKPKAKPVKRVASKNLPAGKAGKKAVAKKAKGSRKK